MSPFADALAAVLVRYRFRREADGWAGLIIDRPCTVSTVDAPLARLEPRNVVRVTVAGPGQGHAALCIVARDLHDRPETVFRVARKLLDGSLTEDPG